MTALPTAPPIRRGVFLRLAASRGFQAWAARMPGLRRIVKAEGEALFDLVAGFVNTQVLTALVELKVLHHLRDGSLMADQLAGLCSVSAERMQVLLQAGAGLGLLKRRRDGGFVLSVRGASVLGVPGLQAMILHNKALYADLANPVTFLRDGTDTELARFWPYVFGAAAAEDPDVSATYSDLMADSQVLVAEDTLRKIDLSGVRRLLDVGGGTGAFLSAVGAAYPQMELSLFDLPAVLDVAGQRLDAAGLAGRVTLHPGSFRDDRLPRGFDAISLVRVLYDHNDSTVADILRAVHAALPAGGQLIISEPMSGGAKPDRATDVYYAIYTLAMQTGRTRSAAELAGFLVDAGFTRVCIKTGNRPFITSVITSVRG